MDVPIKKELEINPKENIEVEINISTEEIYIKADLDYEEDEFETDNQLCFQNNQVLNLNNIPQPVNVKNEFNIESEGYKIKKEEDDPNIHNHNINQEELIQKRSIISDITTIAKTQSTIKNNQTQSKTKTLENNKTQKTKVYICEFCNKIMTDHSNYRTHKRIHTGERPYNCSLCSKSFKQSAHLKGHIITHTGKKQHTCNICHMSFTLLKNQKRHMQSHTDTDLDLACNKCHKQYSDKRTLDLHSEKLKEVQSFQCLKHTGLKPFEGDSSIVYEKAMNNNQSKTKILENNKTQKTKVYICEFCNKIMKDHSNYRTHKRIHTGERPYICSHCPKSFKQSGHLKVHIITHTANKQHTCNTCHKSFTQSNNLEQHMRSHTDTKYVACNKCDKQYPDTTVLNLHSETHNEVQSFQSLECYKTYSQKSHTGLKPFECDPSIIYEKELTPKLCKISLNTTITKTQKAIKNNQSKTKIPENNKTQKTKVYICEFCNKIMTDHSNYRTHKRIHTGERPYNCSRCPKSFKQSAHLKSHIATHTAKKHTCNICHTSFAQSSNLKKHMRSHTDTKDFTCNKCDKQYFNNKALNLHSETHNAVQSFQCLECNTTYCHESFLIAHLKTQHTGIKPLECDFCGKIFFEKKSIGAHLRIHMSQKLYKCKLCDKKFNQSCARKVHMKTHEKSTFLKELKLFPKCFKTFRKQYCFDVQRKRHCKMADLEILGL